MAVAAWNMAGGLDWSALPVVCEVLGIREPDVLIAQLVAIRDAQSQRT